MRLLVDEGGGGSRGQRRRRVDLRVSAAHPACLGGREPVGVAAAAAVQEASTDARHRLEVPARRVVAAAARVVLQQAQLCHHTQQQTHSSVAPVYHTEHLQGRQCKPVTGSKYQRGA